VAGIHRRTSVRAHRATGSAAIAPRAGTAVGRARNQRQRVGDGRAVSGSSRSHPAEVRRTAVSGIGNPTIASLPQLRAALQIGYTRAPNAGLCPFARVWRGRSDKARLRTQAFVPLPASGAADRTNARLRRGPLSLSPRLGAANRTNARLRRGPLSLSPRLARQIGQTRGSEGGLWRFDRRCDGSHSSGSRQ
jgi:hypothetical protein